VTSASGSPHRGRPGPARWFALVALLVAAVLGAGDLPVGAQDGGRPDEPATEEAGAGRPAIEDLTPWVAENGEFAARARLPEGYPGGLLRARLFRAVDDGAEVRELDDPTNRFRWATYEVEVPEGAQTATVRIPFGEGEGYRLQLGPGAYPVLIELLPDEGEPWSALTYLVRPGLGGEVGESGTEPAVTPVALVVPVEAPVHWAPAVGVTLAEEDLARIGALAATLSAFPEVPVTLAIEPAVVTALANTPGGAVVRDGLAAAGRRGAVLNAPYAAVAAGSWAGTLLDPALVDQFAAGEAALTSFLGRPPDGSTWVVDAGDSPDLLEWLSARGVDRFLLTPHVPGGGLAGGDAALRLAGITEDHRAYAAATLDAPFPATDESPVLQANHLLAALSADVLTWRRQPIVLLAPGPAGADATSLAVVLRALSEPGPLAPVVASTLPSSAPASIEVPRPAPPSGDRAELVDDVSRLRGRLASFTATVGAGDLAVAELRRPVLLAGRDGTDHATRARLLADLEALMRAQLAGVELVDGGALTVTSHQARLPVTIRNTSGRSLEVAVTAASEELAMLGDPLRLTLLPGVTEDVEIPFRVSRSGDFEVDVSITTPDGGFVLAAEVVTLRSTAVSGVGVVLSVGALAFLGLWWARNRRGRRRRPSRSVAAPMSTAPDTRVGEPVP
jgi:hypothetical protein